MVRLVMLCALVMAGTCAVPRIRAETPEDCMRRVFAAGGSAGAEQCRPDGGSK